MKFERIGFTEFLAESEEQVSYKQKLDSSDPKKIIDMIKSNCFNMNIKKPYWRGMKSSGDCLLIDGSKGQRKSNDTTNYYTMLIDHFAKKDQPLRTKSLICETNAGKNYAKRYADMHMGDLYAVYPYDNADIGFVGKQDIWDVEVNINGDKLRTVKWNDQFKAAGLDESSYDSFIASIKKIFDKPEADRSQKETQIYMTFGRKFENVEKHLENAYSADKLKFKIGSTATIDGSKESEVWISGNCIFVKYDFWKEHMK